MNAAQLISFERSIADAFERGEIRGPVHLSGGNESQLIEIFKNISPEDYVFSTWRNHLHALLHGIPEEWVRSEILAGRSMNLMNHEHRFFTSAIVGGILPIAVGVAAALKRQGSDRKVWCFVGDMTSTTGIFHETLQYSLAQELPLVIVVEDNGKSTDSPTLECWGAESLDHLYDGCIHYKYERTYPHVGTGAFVSFV